jgi:hypothetical protein
MSDSVYRVTELIGVSEESWEAATRNAVQTAGGTIRDLRVAEVLRQDVTIEGGKVTATASGCRSHSSTRAASSLVKKVGERRRSGRCRWDRRPCG